MLGVDATRPFDSRIGKPAVAGTAEAIARGLDPAAWRRLSAGEGTKGPRLHDRACLEPAGLDGAEYDDRRAGPWTRGLPVRRSLADGGLAFFSTWCPAGTGIATLVRVEGRRWAIGDGFETAETELGLDHNETRSWHGRHRHVSLVRLGLRRVGGHPPAREHGAPPKTSIRLARTRRASSAGRSRSSAASLSASPSDASDPPTSSPGRTGDAPTRPPHDAPT